MLMLSSIVIFTNCIFTPQILGLEEHISGLKIIHVAGTKGKVIIYFTIINEMSLSIKCCDTSFYVFSSFLFMFRSPSIRVQRVHFVRLF